MCVDFQHYSAYGKQVKFQRFDIVVLLAMIDATEDSYLIIINKRKHNSCCYPNHSNSGTIYLEHRSTNFETQKLFLEKFDGLSICAR